ncbi:hypothetical protein [Brevundimonas pondensis]|uniref:hypothetical protein n=1 Tax=Brevundimonas pondensis TaxID=2774189 RepID=UPI001A9E3EA2|nr:hypothetical protein [Brevundimonas pondensis]
MRFVLLVATLVAMKIWPEQMAWIAVGACAIFNLQCIAAEEKAKARVRELERELGYVTRSRRSVKDLMKGLPLGQQAAGLSDRD